MIKRQKEVNRLKRDPGTARQLRTRVRRLRSYSPSLTEAANETRFYNALHADVAR